MRENDGDLTFGGSGTKDGGGLGSLFNTSLLPDLFIRVLGSGWGLYSHTHTYAEEGGGVMVNGEIRQSNGGLRTAPTSSE